MKLDSARFMAYPAGAAQGSSQRVVRRGQNRYWIYDQGNPIEVVTDDDGRLVSVDGSRTTLRIVSRRQPAIDISALAASFWERERATGAVTALSPRDSAVATIGGVRVAVDYGRPAARGRTVWGPHGVLGDTLWRTGANASTKFITDGVISIGGRLLPAGTYSLMTLAVPGRYQLIFYQNDAEVWRAPLQAMPLDPRVERFTILIEPASSRTGTLRLRWDTLDLSVPFTIPAGPAD
jgi:hypothetical protein